MEKKKVIEDTELVSMALQGQQDAYTKIMDRYKDSLRFTIGKMIKNSDDAEDILMEAFAKVFQKLPSYKSEFAFSTWLFNIGINHAIDFMRLKKLETLSLTTTLDDENNNVYEIDIKDNKLDPEETFIKNQRSQILRDTLNRLSPQYKRIVELRFIDEMSYEEISNELNMPIGSVKGHLHRAKGLLQEILKTTINKV